LQYVYCVQHHDQAPVVTVILTAGRNFTGVPLRCILQLLSVNSCMLCSLDPTELCYDTIIGDTNSSVGLGVQSTKNSPLPLGRNDLHTNIGEENCIYTLFMLTTDIKLHNCDLHNLYSSADVVRMMKSRWVGWAGM